MVDTQEVKAVPRVNIDELWELPLNELTKEQRSLMFKADRKRAFFHITIARRKEWVKNGGRVGRRKDGEEKASDITSSLGGLTGIDKVTRRILSQIENKINEADVLDLAKTLDILSDVKAKALKDSLSVQAANYTPTVITEDKEQIKSTEPIQLEPIDRPLIDVIEPEINDVS